MHCYSISDQLLYTCGLNPRQNGISGDLDALYGEHIQNSGISSKCQWYHSMDSGLPTVHHISYVGIHFLARLQQVQEPQKSTAERNDWLNG